MPYRRRRRRTFRRRRGRSSYRSRTPWRSLRRGRRARRAPATTRAILSNRRSIQTIRAAIEVKRETEACWPDSSGEINPLTAGGCNTATGSSGINSGPDVPITVDGRGFVVNHATLAYNNKPFNPGLIVTRLGLGNRGIPDNPATGAPWSVRGNRIGRYVSMRTLAIKVQAKLRRDCPQNATVKLHLFLVLDKDPTMKWDAGTFQDINFALSDKKVDYFPGVTGGLIDNPQRMQYSRPKDEPVQQRFRVLQKKTLYLSRGGSDIAPIDTSGIPPYETVTAHGNPVTLATGCVAECGGQNSSLMPTRGQGSSSAPFVNYTTLFLKANYKFDFGDTLMAGQQQYQLPINHQIRLCAYTESTGVALTDGTSVAARSIPVELVYSGNFRFTDS